MYTMISLLKDQNCEHEIIRHEKTIQSAQEGADYFGIEIGQTAPTLVLKSEEGYFAIIISGDYGRIDFDILKPILKCNELKLAKPKEVEQLTGCIVGTVPLIGHNLPTIMDRQLHRFDYVYGGTGIPNSTLKISPDAVEKLNQVIAYVR
ncbi:aminoacyl-tRNA deacylase [Cohnella cholangitidis]|uniref:YbaK/EbsC family protein n=1 Tax=Cohnella cholangitidis TaxID=2598458 RepID=A0A7G5C659_9BACL|nr:YbaK/EbsC family protein [Cohnella cholangitidis]QMV44693.1 YbaK/EbsC family protein [Cohnella cholangitidis]